MKDKIFSLLHEPWIKVITIGLREKIVSLKTFFAEAHTYRRLAGDTPEQDMAMLRLLISIVLTAFFRYNAKGVKEKLEDEEDVLTRFGEFYSEGRFTDAIQNYLQEHQEEFYLIHPTNPFFQSAGIDKLMPYPDEIKPLSEMINLQSESASANTKTFFRMSEDIKSLSLAEAARWLVFYQSYAHSMKIHGKDPDEKKANDGKKKKNLPRPNLTPCINRSMKVGNIEVKPYLGRLMRFTVLSAEGYNLFETIMLNLCALKNGEEMWGEPKPAWEQEPCSGQARYVDIPDNIPELYTLQSRRALLVIEDGQVTGLKAMWGDYTIPDDGSTPEQMAIWIKGKEKMKPMTVKRTTAIWREFGTLIYNQNGNTAAPGVVRWISLLIEAGLYSAPLVRFRTLTHFPSGKAMFLSFGDNAEDSLGVSYDLLTQVGQDWIPLIVDEINKCCGTNKCADALRPLSCEKNTDPKINSSYRPLECLAPRYLELIDHPFREWICSIDENSSKEEKRLEWEETSARIANEVARDYINLAATTGNRLWVDGSGANKVTRIIYLKLAEKYDEFRGKLKRIYPDLYKNVKTQEEKKDGE